MGKETLRSFSVISIVHQHSTSTSKPFQGRHVIVIGPAKETNRFTECSPLNPPFPEGVKLEMIHFSEFGDNKDQIAIYEKFT